YYALGTPNPGKYFMDMREIKNQLDKAFGFDSTSITSSFSQKDIPLWKAPTKLPKTETVNAILAPVGVGFYLWQPVNGYAPEKYAYRYTNKGYVTIGPSYVSDPGAVDPLFSHLPNEDGDTFYFSDLNYSESDQNWIELLPWAPGPLRWENLS